MYHVLVPSPPCCHPRGRGGKGAAVGDDSVAAVSGVPRGTSTVGLLRESGFCFTTEPSSTDEGLYDTGAGTLPLQLRPLLLLMLNPPLPNKRYAPAAVTMASKARETITMPAMAPEDRGGEALEITPEPEGPPFGEGRGVGESEAPEGKVVGEGVGVEVGGGVVLGDDPVEGVWEGVGVGVGVWVGLSDAVGEEVGDVPTVGDAVEVGEGEGVEVGVSRARVEVQVGEED